MKTALRSHPIATTAFIFGSIVGAAIAPALAFATTRVQKEGITDSTGATGDLNFSESRLDSGDLVSFTCAAGGGDRTTLTQVVD